MKTVGSHGIINKHIQKGGDSNLPKVIVRDGESLDDAFRRFKRNVNKSGILADYKRHEAYLKRGLRRKMKAQQARRRH